MRAPDVALIAPYPPRGALHGGWTGVASYTANLAGALADAGARVTVVASASEAGEPAVWRSSEGVEVRRVWRRGATALPAAATAARATGAPVVHLQHELFLYGGPTAASGVLPALATLRARGPRTIVTLHHVVDPGAVDASFTATHGVPVPAPVARAGVSALQRGIAALADTVVVHEPEFAGVLHGTAVVVPHGIEVAGAVDRGAARTALGVAPGRLCALCFGFLAPYKGLEAALGAARLAGDEVSVVVAGGAHPRATGYADRLRASAPAGVRFTGYVPDEDVARWFAAADVVLLPYPRPFASSGPLALALAHGTPVLLSPALARTTGAPRALAVGLDPAAIAARLRSLARRPAERDGLRSAAERLAAGRTWPDVARRHLDLYGALDEAVAA